MTALRRPSTTSRLAAVTSPWIQTGGAVPRRREGCFPHLGCSVGVDLGVQGRDRLSRLAVIGGQRPAAKEVVPSGCRAACGIDPVEGGEEVGQVGREPVEIRNSSTVACSPASHRYTDHGLGNPTPGSAFRQGLRDGKGQLRREDRQPPMLLVHLQDVRVGARQSNRQVLAETEGRVVPSRRAPPA